MSNNGKNQALDLSKELDGPGTIKMKSNGVEKDIFIKIRPKPRYENQAGGWVVAWQEGLMSVFLDKRLNATDVRIAGLLCCICDANNLVEMSLSQMEEIFKIAKSNISVSLKKLRELGYIDHVKMVGNTKIYRVDSALIFKGNLQIAVRERLKSLEAKQEKPGLRLVSSVF